MAFFTISNFCDLFRQTHAINEVILKYFENGNRVQKLDNVPSNSKAFLSFAIARYIERFTRKDIEYPT